MATLPLLLAGAGSTPSPEVEKVGYGCRKPGAMFFRVGYFTTRSQVKIDSTTGEVSSGVSIRKDTRFGP